MRIPEQQKNFYKCMKLIILIKSFTDKGKLAHYANLIRENEVGMLSDAGTPGLSDPGKMLVQICQNE